MSDNDVRSAELKCLDVIIEAAKNLSNQDKKLLYHTICVTLNKWNNSLDEAEKKSFSEYVSYDLRKNNHNNVIKKQSLTDNDYDDRPWTSKILDQ